MKIYWNLACEIFPVNINVIEESYIMFYLSLVGHLDVGWVVFLS